MTGKYWINDDGDIDGGIPMPECLHNKLTEEELIQVRRFYSDRFEMGYWYRGYREGDE